MLNSETMLGCAVRETRLLRPVSQPRSFPRRSHCRDRESRVRPAGAVLCRHTQVALICLLELVTLYPSCLALSHSLCFICFFTVASFSLPMDVSPPPAPAITYSAVASNFVLTLESVLAGSLSESGISESEGNLSTRFG